MSTEAPETSAIGGPSESGLGGPGGVEGPEMDGGKKSSWMKLVMKVKKSNPKLSLGQAMKKAKSMYKKTRRGGASISPLPLSGGGAPLTPATIGGRRKGGRKGSKKTRRTSRKH